MAEVAQTAVGVNEAEDFREKEVKVQKECNESEEMLEISKENLRKLKEWMTKLMGVRLNEEIEKNEVTKGDLELKSPKKITPEFIIYDVEDDLKVEEAINMIKEQNEELKKGAIKLEYIMKIERSNNWVISLDSDSFRKIRKNCKGNLELESS
ncbi:hypothetical protein AVEN_161818-1 [Araneus ventricosus]|uniref:Uncharacterized protein n=1 Tax=Araneus ventricosus TaxID=182803 RepID=A0A4Y2MEP0_ARAVE|nr:hypothetical protein AVEN_161818-1 [Araneus ventricosus]